MSTKARLAHIPGPRPRPLVGHTLDVIRDAFGFCSRVEAEYGPVYKIHNLGKWRVYLSGPDALEFVLNDREQLFSVKQGWEMIERLFSGGILLRDFDDHRRHRRILQSAFKANVVETYVTRMTEELERQVARWPLDESFQFYPRIKDLTLRLGASVFLGLDADAPEAAEFNRLVTAEANAIIGVIRRPLPFTAMGRGVAARRALKTMLAKLIPERRANPGDDFFSQMCCAVDEDGKSWTDAEIIDHFNFLLASSHDTTASTLSKIIWALGTHPRWQDRIAAEIEAAGPGPLSTRQLGGLRQTDKVFREAMRMMPPVPFILRRALRDFHWGGYDIPAGTWVYVSPALTMRDPAIYSNPLRFDPDRFDDDRAEDKAHKFAFAPFGGGAHKCIGMHFAGFQAKAFLAALTRHGRIELTGEAYPDWQHVPIPMPRDGLPVRLRSVTKARSTAPAPAIAAE